MCILLHVFATELSELEHSGWPSGLTELQFIKAARSFLVVSYSRISRFVILSSVAEFTNISSFCNSASTVSFVLVCAQGALLVSFLFFKEFFVAIFEN